MTNRPPESERRINTVPADTEGRITRGGGRQMARGQAPAGCEGCSAAAGWGQKNIAPYFFIFVPHPRYPRSFPFPLPPPRPLNAVAGNLDNVSLNIISVARSLRLLFLTAAIMKYIAVLCLFAPLAFAQSSVRGLLPSILDDI
jgi:hypothetical protein